MKPKGKFRQIIVTLLALLLSSYSLGGSLQQCNYYMARQCWLYKDAKATDSREAIIYIYIYILRVVCIKKKYHLKHSMVVKIYPLPEGAAYAKS